MCDVHQGLNLLELSSNYHLGLFFGFEGAQSAQASPNLVRNSKLSPNVCKCVGVHNFLTASQ